MPGGHSAWEGAGHQGLRAPTSSVPQKFFIAPQSPGAMASPRFGGRARRVCPVSSPQPLTRIKILPYRFPRGRGVPAHSSLPGAGTDAIIGVTGCPQPAASGRSTRRRLQDASRSWGGGGLAALCHVLPRHAPGPPSQCCSIWWKVGRPRGAGKDVEALPSGPRQSWIQMACLTSPGAGRARLGHSRQPARAPGAVRTEAASRPAERLPFPAACGWLSPHPRDHPTLVSGAQSSALREATCRQ